MDHELDQVAQLVRSTLIGLAMTSFLHWKMGTKPVLVRRVDMHVAGCDTVRWRTKAFVCLSFASHSTNKHNTHT